MRFRVTISEICSTTRLLMDTNAWKQWSRAARNGAPRRPRQIPLFWRLERQTTAACLPSHAKGRRSKPAAPIVRRPATRVSVVWPASPHQRHMAVVRPERMRDERGREGGERSVDDVAGR